MAVDCTNVSEVRLAVCNTSSDMEEMLQLSDDGTLTTNYNAKPIALLVKEKLINDLQRLGIDYVWSYVWADATARNAQTGMIANEYGYQTDTDAIYQYNGASWVLVSVTAGEQSFNIANYQVLKYSTSWDFWYQLANQNEIDTNTANISKNTNSRLSVVVNAVADADITLTDTQNEYGRIEITDTGALLTTARNVIMNDTERTFLFVNSTAQDLTVKNAAGTGISVASGEAKQLRNDTTNVINYEATQEATNVFAQKPVYSQKTTTQSSAATIPHDNTIPQQTEGFEITDLNTTITPVSSSNDLEIEFIIVFSDTATNDQTVFALFRDATANAIGSTVTTSFGANGPTIATFKIRVNAGSTSATTFKVRAGGQGATTTINGGGTGGNFGGNLTSTMTVTEIVV